MKKTRVINLKPSNMTTTKEIEQAIKTLQQNGYLVQSIWQKADLDTLCEEESLKPLTQDQAVDFFDFFGRNHDANLGVNWEVLRIQLKEWLAENKLLDKKYLTLLPYPHLRSIMELTPNTVIDDAWEEYLLEEKGRKKLKELKKLTGMRNYKVILKEYEGLTIEELTSLYI